MGRGGVLYRRHGSARGMVYCTREVVYCSKGVYSTKEKTVPGGWCNLCIVYL